MYVNAGRLRPSSSQTAWGAPQHEGVCAAALTVTNCLLHLSHCCRESVVQLSRCCFTFVNNINHVTVLCTFYNVPLLPCATPVFLSDAPCVPPLTECLRCARSPHHSFRGTIQSGKYTKTLLVFFSMLCISLPCRNLSGVAVNLVLYVTFSVFIIYLLF